MTAQERTSYRVFGRVRTRALYAARMAGRQPLLDVVSIVPASPHGVKWPTIDGRAAIGTLRLISAKTDAYLRPRERQALAEFLARLPLRLEPVVEIHYRDPKGHLHRKTIRTVADLDFFSRKGEGKFDAGD